MLPFTWEGPKHKLSRKLHALPYWVAPANCSFAQEWTTLPASNCGYQLFIDRVSRLWAFFVEIIRCLKPYDHTRSRRKTQDSDGCQDFCEITLSIIWRWVPKQVDERETLKITRNCRGKSAVENIVCKISALFQYYNSQSAKLL